jgi:hypothetical protein|tara:strand:+ start:606 stop:929 length:324 start_codon:yes stop_codon:yes gene_type:complete
MSATKEPNDVLKEAEDVAERRDAEHDMTEKKEDSKIRMFETDWDELKFWFATGRVNSAATKHGSKRLIEKFHEAYDDGDPDAKWSLEVLDRVLTIMTKLVDEKKEGS